MSAADDQQVGGIDFTLTGMPLNEWLGVFPHEAVLKAADIAMRRPEERIIVGIARATEPPVMNRWSARERPMLLSWFRSKEPEAAGRLRLGTTHELDPATQQDVIVAFVVREPKYRKPRPKAVKA